MAGAATGPAMAMEGAGRSGEAAAGRGRERPAVGRARGRSGEAAVAMTTSPELGTTATGGRWRQMGQRRRLEEEWDFRV